MSQLGFPRWLGGRQSACPCRRHRFNPWVGSTPWSRKWQPTPVFLPGKSHGQRSLAGRLQSMWSQRVRCDWATERVSQLQQLLDLLLGLVVDVRIKKNLHYYKKYRMCVSKIWSFLETFPWENTKIYVLQMDFLKSTLWNSYTISEFDISKLPVLIKYCTIAYTYGHYLWCCDTILTLPILTLCIYKHLLNFFW